MKSIPQRTCIGCNTKKDKKDLIRIVINKENEISIDIIGKKPGRGTYICNNVECLEKAIKTKKIERALKHDFSKDMYNELRNLISGGDING